ncbi:MAG: NTP transferase domain-containing protein [Bacteroidota bacterium]|nr:NTP transferase domain-containing protein [Bacteroidota bacterium]MDX5430530.1 NTP transferase domain-containing protein [Bacteroidota bacterium]MDX5469283.1 NTP transferase domain-containing protein [Bacteroidota bacterium]
MKAIIPVAGIGSRLRPHTHTQPKALIPVAGKPILGHIVDGLLKGGIDELVFIIGYLGDKIESYIRSAYPDLKTHFVIQTTGKGIGHAIWLAKDLIQEEEDILIVLGDTIWVADLKKVLESETSSIGVMKVDDPRQFGVAQINKDGFVTSLIEKPRIPKSNMALIGVYYIKNAAHLKQALEYNIDNDIRTNNEFHLTDALMRMVEAGEKIQTFSVDAWFDCGKKDILLETNATLLKQQSPSVIAPKNPSHTILIPPVYVAPDAQISHSIIGPNVSIGEGAIIHNSIISESIIGPYAHLENAVLKASLIGNDASLHGLVQSLNLGDSTEIDYNR